MTIYVKNFLVENPNTKQIIEGVDYREATRIDYAGPPRQMSNKSDDLFNGDSITLVESQQPVLKDCAWSRSSCRQIFGHPIGTCQVICTSQGNTTVGLPSYTILPDLGFQAHQHVDWNTSSTLPSNTVTTTMTMTTIPSGTNPSSADL